MTNPDRLKFPFVPIETTASPGRESLPFLVVSAWTPQYRDHGTRLVASLESAGLDYHTVVYPSLGSWEANCGVKSEVVVAHLRHSGRPIVWLDADATVEPGKGPDVLAYFGDLARAQVDFAGMYDARRPEWPLVNSDLISNTVFFGGSVESVRIAEHWAGACRLRATVRRELDQDVLLDSLSWARGVFKYLRAVPISPHYACIRDLMPGVEDPSIVQHQASRVLKDQVV